MLLEDYQLLKRRKMAKTSILTPAGQRTNYRHRNWYVRSQHQEAVKNPDRFVEITQPNSKYSSLYKIMNYLIQIKSLNSKHHRRI